jgi:hypothetical protein
VLGKFEIRYGFEGFDEKSNIPYRNSLRFGMDFELKFQEASMG